MNARKYALYGVILGVFLPIVAVIVEAGTGPAGLTGEGILLAVQKPLVLIVITAPLFLGAFASMAGHAQDEALRSETGKREGFLEAARTLVTMAQSLLSNVSAFSSMTAETAASVRETTATMGQLAQTATKAALTAETVIGLAQAGARVSTEGLKAVDTSQGEMAKLADEVRQLSQRIEALNARMRDIFEIASVVNYIADRSQRLADRAAQASTAPLDGGAGFAEVVGEMRHHAEDAKKAAVQVKGILAEVHQAMLAAMTAAEVGIRRAEQGATVASGTGDTIRRLATALRESSEAAREIATVAQQQDHGIEQVLKAMNEIYLATQETMTNIQSVATEARALNDMATGLKRAVTE
jgi:methyl-accepting chemotaxis protein